MGLVVCGFEGVCIGTRGGGFGSCVGLGFRVGGSWWELTWGDFVGSYRFVCNDTDGRAFCVVRIEVCGVGRVRLSRTFCGLLCGQLVACRLGGVLASRFACWEVSDVLGGFWVV